jgi:hypothetical protein
MIIAAAIKVGSLVHFMPQPARHNDILLEMAKNGVPKPINGEQGFITQSGRFVGRELAFEIANSFNQIKIKHGRQIKLYSEDIW